MDIPVQVRCNGFCAVHCDAQGEDSILLTSGDAAALLEWLGDRKEPSFRPRSSSRLLVDDAGSGGLVLRIRPWPAE